MEYTTGVAISRPRPGRSSAAPASAEARLPEIVEMTAGEAWADYDARARELLGVSAEEFERRWRNGDYDDPVRHESAVRVWMIRVERPNS